MKRLLKKEIKVVPVKVLNMRYCRILERGETMDAKDIPAADAREILWIEDELRDRIIKLIGHDFYPPDGVAKPTMAEMRAKLTSIAKPVPVYHTTQIIHPCSAAVTKKAEAEIKPGTKIKFKITVTSSIGSKVAERTIHVDSKSDAYRLANEMIRDLGLKKATYKIS